MIELFKDSPFIWGFVAICLGCQVVACTKLVMQGLIYVAQHLKGRG